MGFRSNNHEKEPHSFDIQARLVRKSYILIVASTFHDRSREVQPLLVTHHTPKLPLLFERPFFPHRCVPGCAPPINPAGSSAQLCHEGPPRLWAGRLATGGRSFGAMCGSIEHGPWRSCYAAMPMLPLFASQYMDRNETFCLLLRADPFV